MTRLGAGAEFDLIRALAERWGPLATGLGDDASVLSLPRGERVVVSTDASVEGVHFRRDWMSLREIGHRAAVAALSDLAAMAARPRGLLVAFTVPAARRDELLEVADGVADAVRSAETVIIGGNLSVGPALSITSTVVGTAYAPLARSAARPGDALYVTGVLGGPAAAVRALEAGAQPPAAVRERFMRPSPRLREARWLAVRGVVAAIDVSDGLAADAGHLAAASSVTVEIDAGRVPVCPGASADDALGGGEEYELLVAARQPLDEPTFAETFGIRLTRIGQVVAAGAQPVVLSRAGTQISAPMGYDHFAR